MQKTAFDILYVAGQINYWIVFGTAARVVFTDERAGREWFGPGVVVGYIRWEANDYGTQNWNARVVRTGRPGDMVQPIPGISPGAEVLVHACGTGPVNRFFQHLDALQAAGFDPADVSPDYWLDAADAIATRGPVAVYTADWHASYLRSRHL